MAGVTVESLPDEMLAFITQFLTVKELASCCAVSVSWREVFGKDILWQPRCDKTLVSHLATSKPLVEPHFVSPATEDSTISDIGEWRLNYMRENHLWNNWRQCKFKQINLNCHLEKYPVSLNLFYSNDCILGYSKNQLKLWFLKDAPESHTIHTFRNKRVGLTFFKVPKSENILILQAGVVRVWRLDLTSKTVHTLRTFSIEESEQYSDITEKSLTSVIKEKHKQKEIKFIKYAIIDNLLVGIIIREQLVKMHIWNVETGQKLKEELLPPIAKKIPSEIRFCDKTKNILVNFFEYENGKVFVNCSIYSLSQLCFLPFRQRYSVRNDRDSYCGDIYGTYVAIRAEKTLYIYNYCTSVLIIEVPASGDVKKFQNLFVYDLKMFMRTPSNRFETILSVANPSTKLVEAEFDTANYHFTSCHIIHNKIVAVLELELHSGMVLIRRCTGENLLRSACSSSIAATPLYHLVSDGIVVNETATNIILRGCALNSFAVLSFW